MSCEICGRVACCRSFHSIKEQEEFENGMNKPESPEMEEQDVMNDSFGRVRTGEQDEA
jgi:hypothetical protein